MASAAVNLNILALRRPLQCYKLMDPKQKFKEEDIPGAKLTLLIDKLSRDAAVRLLKCRRARNLSKLTLHELTLK